jgi:hypothetical protein
MWQVFKEYKAILIGLPFALLYGALARLLFGNNLAGDAFATLSIAFLFLVPIAVGALTIWFIEPESRTSWRTAILLPWLSVGIGAVVAGLFFIEAFICIVMALPILLPMGSVGRVLACAMWRRRSKQPNGRDTTTMLGLLLLAPYLAAPLESRFAVRDALATVETHVAIYADAATVWENLVEVPPIQARERTFSVVFDLFGAPKPLAATLDRPGVGGVRYGFFEDNLRFVETITLWEPEQRIAWAIQADTGQVTRAPWPEIGGRYFAVTAADYWIEPVSPGRVILHLRSTHRLSTRINGYGLLWTRWGLSDFQRQILQVIKQRAEAVAS